MGFSLICFVICGFCMWGMLAKFGDRIHDELVEPICITLAKDGRKTIFKFLIVGIIFNSFTKSLSRIPLWIALYYTLLYLNYPVDKVWEFVITLIVVAGVSRTATDVQKHYPTPPNYKAPWNL